MISAVIGFVTHLIIQTISTAGYLGIFVLMALESALIPIPSEVTMPFSGYLVSVGRFNFWAVVVVGALANLVGSQVAYLLGFKGERLVVERLIRRFGRYVLISEDEFYQAEEWFRKHGKKIVFFSRIMPVVRTFISLPAGIAKMDFFRFSVLTFLGSLVWSAFLTYIGFILGRNWAQLDPYYRKFEVAIFIIGLTVVIYYLWRKLKKLKMTNIK